MPPKQRTPDVPDEPAPVAGVDDSVTPCRPGIRGRAGLCRRPGCATCLSWDQQDQAAEQPDA